MASPSHAEQIKITHIIDPGTFWFIGVNSQDLGKRDETERALTDYLESNHDSPRSGQRFKPQQGELVAVKIGSSWKRGQVMPSRSGSANSYSIFLLDHGIPTIAPVHDIRELPKKFISDFSASRLRLNGLEIVGDPMMPQSRSMEWNSAALHLVAKMLDNQSSCYLSMPLTNMVGNTVFGSIFVIINQERVNLIDELVKHGFAVKSQTLLEEEKSYKTDPLELTLGGLICDARQVVNPLTCEMANLAISEDAEKAELCGIGTSPKKREPAVVANPWPSREGERVKKCYPAGIGISGAGTPSQRGRTPEQPVSLNKSPSPQVNTQANQSSKTSSVDQALDPKVKFKPVTPGSDVSFGSSPGSSPVSPSDQKLSKRAQKILQNAAQAASTASLIETEQCVRSIPREGSVADLQGPINRQELSNTESRGDLSQTEGVSLKQDSPKTTENTNVSKRTLRLRQLAKAKESAVPEASTSTKVLQEFPPENGQQLSEGGNDQQILSKMSSGDGPNNRSSGEANRYKKEFQPDGPTGSGDAFKFKCLYELMTEMVDVENQRQN